jgi:hypothetical protein
VRDAGCEMRGARCEVRDARCEMRGERCEVRDARCEMRRRDAEILSREQQRCGQTDEPVEVVVVVRRRKSRAEGGWMKACAVGHVMGHVVQPRNSIEQS